MAENSSPNIFKDKIMPIHGIIIVCIVLIFITAITIFYLGKNLEKISSHLENIRHDTNKANERLSEMNKNASEKTDRMNESLGAISSNLEKLTQGTKEAQKVLTCGMAEANYGLIIDAGSSGSRIYIYCWKPAGANGIPWVKAAPGIEGESPWLHKVGTGLSRYAEDPKLKTEDAWKSLQPLIEYA